MSQLSYISGINRLNRSQLGFTLIEIMTVVSIIAIIASIAVPSYRRYVVTNAESQAKVKMSQMKTELQRWQSSALTYKGFKPKKISKDGVVSYNYDNVSGKSANTAIYVPDGSDSSNYSYIIVLDDGAGSSLAGGRDLSKITVGNSWRMYAEPNSKVGNARKMLMTSTGIRCQSSISSFKISSKCNEAGAKPW